MKLTTIFYHTDEFCKFFEKEINARALSSGYGIRTRKCSLTLSEAMTIAIYYHDSGYKTFKDYYVKNAELKIAFPTLPSYNRFVELQKNISAPLLIFAKLQASARCNGISFIDSFPLRVSHEKRTLGHKTFSGVAARGKTSMGWFYEFKIHVIINGAGEMLNFTITSGNVTDNNSHVIDLLTQEIHGKVYGDKGYLLNSNLFEKLYLKGIHFITKVRKNMQGRIMDIRDRLMLKKRGVIESVGAILKENLNIEHSRYRSMPSLIVNVCSALVAYALRKNKPSIYGKNSYALNA